MAANLSRRSEVVNPRPEGVRESRSETSSSVSQWRFFLSFSVSRFFLLRVAESFFSGEGTGRVLFGFTGFFFNRLPSFTAWVRPLRILFIRQFLEAGENQTCNEKYSLEKLGPPKSGHPTSEDFIGLFFFLILFDRFLAERRCESFWFHSFQFKLRLQ